MQIKENGVLDSVEYLASSHSSPRPPNTFPNLLVIHCISLPPETFEVSTIKDFFCGKLKPNGDSYLESRANMRVSSHLLLDREGAITQFVSFDDQAWHAGESSFEGRGKCNEYSIGIELLGCETVPYTEGQYQQLGKVSQLLMNQFPGITKERIVGHSDIAPGRKTDPGDSFDWDLFKRNLESARITHGFS
jgi:AmpD protein